MSNISSDFYLFTGGELMFTHNVSDKKIHHLRRTIKREIQREEMDTLLRNIYLGIEGELNDVEYYNELAEKAPDQFQAEMLREFARDEREHAYDLKKAYEALSGEPYAEEELGESYSLNFIESLDRRLLAETADFKKYKSYYLMTDNLILRDIFFNIMHDEAYHAMRLMYLIELNSRPELLENEESNNE